uniref:Transcription initiation factor TFIID subunit 8 n=1 Tax=Chrysotila carterae TaxID=13221 RepID=A0A7S4C278_CHRCT|mmetsp:Transcript_26091/g.54773  ORF Transcript_26091/g.54773 Transcript_26091/m.54773 type:complete len:327 (+) Transcript_26091:143-1123(+)
MADPYAQSLLKVAVAQMVRENNGGATEGQHNAYDAVESSALDVLIDVCARYIRTLGTLGAQAAQHAGRAESNFLDVQLALEHIGAAPLDELLSFAHASDLPFARDVATFPARRNVAVAVQPVTRIAPRPAFIPEYLLPFPDEATYKSTSTRNSRPRSTVAARKKRSKLRRQAQDALLTLQQSCSGSTSGAALPALQEKRPRVAQGGDAAKGADDDGGDVMLEGSALRSTVRAGTASASTLLHEVPDVLLPGQPAVLQSSETLECAGTHADVALPLRIVKQEPGAEVLDPSSISGVQNARRSKAEAILNLQHKHDLEEVVAGGGDDD